MNSTTSASNPDETVPPAAVGAVAPGLLDERALEKLRELDPDGTHGVVARVLRAFESSLVRMQVQLADARDRGDAAAVGAIAHTLKSSSASVGALVLAESCTQAERAMRAGDTAGLVPMVENLLAEAERVLGSVRAMLLP